MPYQTIAAAAAGLRSGAATATDLLERSLQAIDRHNRWTNAFIRVDRDDARRAARLVDDERSRGLDRGPLHGIPISLKDLIDVAGQPTTAASHVFKDRLATRDAHIVTRLRQAGAVILGKTNLHEFALGTTSEESAFGPVKHPRDASRSAGGSSGGSAAAVATGMGLGSIGTDTGGSVRIPSAACGVVGLKPTAGEIPTQGIVPLSWSLDHAGPLGRTVQDVAWMWAAMADQPLDWMVPPGVTTLRLARLGGYFGLAAGEVRTAFEGALEDLRARGATITEQALTNASSIPQAYANIVLPEAAVVHASYLETRAADYTPAVRSRIESGRTIPAVAYLHACAARTTLRAAVDALLDGCDALVLPTLPILAPVIGSSDVLLDNEGGERLTVRAAMLRQTQLFNMTGHPAITLPLRTAGLPVGLQLVGRLGQTPRLLAMAAAVEHVVSPHVDAGVPKADAPR
jgi:aspartyl-tRNA(Asn)/glutamyl-tRNA(Gln) amidotransferase subunit A